jgi:hypothetical protein
MDRQEPDNQPVHEEENDPLTMLLTTTKNRTLYYEAICSAFYTLMEHAAAHGRSWHHYSEGELIIGTGFIRRGAL